MLKFTFILLLAVGYSLQTPVDETESPKENEPTTNTPLEEDDEVDEPETPEVPEIPEMNPDGECPIFDLEFPVYLSDTKNCSIFYQCSNGVPYMMSCTYPLEFNPTLEVCDFPGRSGCLYSKISSFRMIGRCPPNQSSGLKKLLRDSEDNTIYYECVSGKPELRKCPPNTVFTFTKTCEPVA